MSGSPDDREIWVGPATENQYGMHIGETVLVNVHPASACAGHSCVLHNPSDHHMRDWPMVWRDDKGIMERTCPHGVGHPDPDDMAFQITNGRDYLSIHGCCQEGCCRA